MSNWQLVALDLDPRFIGETLLFLYRRLHILRE